ncbi:Spy/CpxP family protein refolding chaperone [Reyranella sp.]|uniref:Spy/CpxP family protein refolding chaperone n=1 Tax=Reyranella sp. TaxID=1929291 RepID=UPI003D0C98BE
MMRQGMMDQCHQAQGMMGMGPMGMMYGPALDNHLDHIRAQLGVTDAQSAAWNSYAGAVKARASTMENMRETMKQAMRSGTAVARMDAHIKAMEGMTESLKALKPATEALYAVLTPEQKQKADALLGTGAMMCTFNTP